METEAPVAGEEGRLRWRLGQRNGLCRTAQAAV